MKFSKQIKRWTALALTVILMVSSMVINASAAYEETVSMYKTIASIATEDEAAILESGALMGDQEITVTMIEPDVDENPVTVKDDIYMTAEAVAAGNGLKWEPAWYRVNYTNGSSDEARYEGEVELEEGVVRSVEVFYDLPLTNFDDADVNTAMSLPYDLVAMYQAVEALAGKQDTLALLDKTVLSVLKGLAEDVDAELAEAIDAIIDNNIETGDVGKNKLKLYNIVDAYDEGGMLYYWENSQDIIDEVESLSSYMGGLVALEDERGALTELVESLSSNDIFVQMGLAEQAEKYIGRINEVTEAVNDVREDMISTQDTIEWIDLESEYLTDLEEAIVNADPDEVNKYDDEWTLWLSSEEPFYVEIISGFSLNVDLHFSDVTGGIAYGYDPGYVLTEEDIEEAIAALDTYIADSIGDNAPYYETDYDEADLWDLVGTSMIQNYDFQYTWTPKEYEVTINGEYHDTVTIEDLTIDLPKAAQPGHKNHYYLNGVEIQKSTYTFKAADLDTLFPVDFTLEVEDVYASNLDKFAQKMSANGSSFKLVKDNTGAYVGIESEVSGNMNDLMSFIMNMKMSGVYDYVGLNGEPLLNGGAFTMQTLVDAVLSDPDFSQDTIIDLGDGKGHFLCATMQLGSSKNKLEYENLELEIALKNLPSPVATLSNAVKAVHDRGFMSFKGNVPASDLMAGAAPELAIELTMPEKIYEVYLAALLATNGADKENINNVEEAVAYEFMVDVVNTLLGKDVTTTTYANTLKKLGINKDLSEYQDYLELVQDALMYDDEAILTYNEDDGNYELEVFISKALLDKVASKVGVTPALLNAIQEYQDGTGISIPATVTVTNFNSTTDYEAIVIDINAVKAPGTMDKLNVVDCTNDLAARLAKVTGYAAVMLQKDINGDLDFSKAGTAILDLNGYDVNGSIKAGDRLIIVDSTMDTDGCGTVSGTVSGNAIIVSGNYASDVSAFLKNGYVQENGTVQNSLYTIDVDAAGNITYVLNASDEIVELFGKDFALALAMDIASDLLLNYYTAAGMDLDGNSIYAIDAFDDLVDLYADYKAEGATATLNEVLGMLHLDKVSATDGGVEGFANIVLADLVDFEAIAAALKENKAVATYALSVHPWELVVDHNAAEDYMVVGVTAAKKAETVNVSLKFAGDRKADLEKMAAALAEINVADETAITVDLTDLTYSNDKLNVIAGGSAVISLDMTGNDNYPIVLAMILADAGIQTDAFVKAVNADDMDALKAAFDKVTVGQMITALKGLKESDSITKMANALGVTVNVAEADALEDAYHTFLVLGGKVLSKLNVTGPSVKMGSLCEEKNKVYTYIADKFNMNRSGAVSRIAYDLSVDEVTLKIALFKEATSSDDDGPSGGGGGGAEKHTSYLTGYADGSLKPYDGITRGQVATIFFRLLSNSDRTKYWSQTNDFSDCSADLWCNNAISTLANMGIIDGYQDGTFRPNAKITRAQFAKIALGYFKATEKSYQGTFSDVAADAWYCSYVEGAAAAGLVQGFEDGTYRPNAYITRAQACVIVNRALGRNPHEDYLLEKSELMTWTDCDSDDWFYADMMEATHSHTAKWMSVKGERIEKWSKKLPQPDWSALEHSWSTANSAKK